MSDETGPLEQESAELDPAQLQYVRQRLDSEQNLPLGVIAGLVASLVGGVAWAGITFATETQIGFMAVGVGFLVGFAVRVAGKGISAIFGVFGAVFSLLGCLIGNLLAVTAFVAAANDIELLDALGQLDLELVQELMVASFTVIDLLFYGIAAYVGYRLAFRQITQADLERMLSGGATG